MRIDKSQRGWAIASLIILAGSTTAYVFSAHESPRGATGGSPLGLLFGSIGFGFMIFAALLGARKRLPVWRIGPEQAWMRGRLWIGVFHPSPILFPGGFLFGCIRTAVLYCLV